MALKYEFHIMFICFSYWKYANEEHVKYHIHMNPYLIFQNYNLLAEFFRFFSHGIYYIFIKFSRGYSIKNIWIQCIFVLIFRWKLYEKCSKNNLIMYYEVFTHMSMIIYKLIIHMVLIWKMYELNSEFMSWNHVKILCSSLSTLSHVFHVLFSCDF